jgi:threonine synthase
MGYLGLRCEACGTAPGASIGAVCESCWGPLEATYDLDAIRASLMRTPLAGRSRDLWRYRELLPVAPPAGTHAAPGWTPLLPAPRLAARLGIGELWIKNDAACQPTLSFKDRLVAVAVARAVELGMPIVGCSSTGNLAAALAARAASAGLQTVVLVPEGVEPAKVAAATVHGALVIEVRGDYDRANRLSTQVADRYGWGFVNVNLRAFYTEAGKTVGFEIAEQLGGRLPGHLVVPLGGGGLLVKLEQAFREAAAVGIGEGAWPTLHGAQPSGCAPIVDAWRDGRDDVKPVRPNTIVHSLAVGDPADGPRALRAIRATGGRADAPSDAEALDGTRLLAETEGLFVETAGGLVVAAAGRLARDGAFANGRPVVLVITGHGMKTVDSLGPPPIAARLTGSLDEFTAFWSSRKP